MLSVSLLGGLGVTIGDRRIPDSAWRLRKAKGLVKLLALAPGHHLHREEILDALWPDLSPDAASGQLRKALHEARRTLDPDPGATQRYLVSGERLALDAQVDVDAFEGAALTARRTREPAAYRQAIALYRGDLLPEDRYEDWLIDRQAALRADFHQLLVEQAALLEARGDIDGAAGSLRRVLATDPADERAGAGLIRVCALSGRRSEALAVYERLRQALARELDAEPDASTQRLYEQVKAGYALGSGLTADLWEQVGDLRMMSGDAAGAAAAFDSAIRAGPTGTGTIRLHRKAVQAYLVDHRTDAAYPHLRAAESALAGSKDQAEAGRVRGARANWLWETGRYEQAHAAAEESMRAAQRHGGADDVAAASETLAIVCHIRGAWQAGLHAEIERFGRAADEDARLARIFDIHCCIGEYHLYGDGLSAGVEAYARRTLDLAVARRARRAQAFAWCLLGESLLLQGRWDEAAGCLQRSTELHAELDARSGALPWQRLAELAACQGDSATAAAHLRHGMAIATVSTLARHAWGRLYATAALDAMERGRPDEAVRAVRSAAQASARYGECPSCSALLNPVAAEAFAAIGDRAGTEPYALAAERVAGSFQSSAWSAMAHSALGALALADHDLAAAHDQHVAAAAGYEHAGHPYWAARESVLAARCGGADAESLLAQAAGVFDRLGVRRAAWARS